MKQHLITREIGIDMGHRVTYHGSKCRNLHGHRYKVIATCVGPLFESGEQEGMVLDFGFLKGEMMNEIDAPCDHGTCLWIEDPILHTLLGLNPEQNTLPLIEQIVRRDGFCLVNLPTGKTYVVPFVPTAENLAKHWYDRLLPRILERTDGKARLARIDVWETPNCSASYGG